MDDSMKGLIEKSIQRFYQDLTTRMNNHENIAVKSMAQKACCLGNVGERLLVDLSSKNIQYNRISKRRISLMISEVAIDKPFKRITILFDFCIHDKDKRLPALNFVARIIVLYRQLGTTVIYAEIYQLGDEVHDICSR